MDNNVIKTLNNDREFRKILGKNLRILREKAGLSQVEFGSKLGFNSSGAISLIENGERGLTGKNLLKACQILGVPPTALMTSSEISDEYADVYLDLATIFSEAVDPRIVNLIRSFLKLAANYGTLNKLEKKVRELESMGIDLEYIIDGILKSKKR